MNSILSQTISDEEAVRFFHLIKKDLNCTSTRKIVSLVRIVLSKIRSSYTPQQLTAIVSKTPTWFHLLMVGNWSSQNNKEIHHLDELVEEILLEDNFKESGLFKSEIDVLNSVISVLNRIQNLFKRAGLKALNTTLSSEVSYAVSEDTYSYS